MPLNFNVIVKPKYVTVNSDRPENRMKFLNELNCIDWNHKLSTRITDNPQANYDIFIQTLDISHSCYTHMEHNSK